MSHKTDGSSAAGPSSPGDYLVVARRYRPQSFEDLVGQNQVSQALATSIRTNRVGHAYLFTGARGVGKTSTARIFAKALNCATGITPTPCNRCDACLAIASGEDIDVLEIDGASNRGIDEIRQLRSNVSIHPSRSRFKIYIIDEVHMLTLQAFNALLKTLEEPPEHVKFLFCTTEVDKIPITILSRCQRYDFAPVESKAIVKRLEYIVQQEGAEAEEEALQLLARRANGSLRDSQSLLEQLLSFSPSRITVQDVHAMLGTARGGQLAALANKLVERDAAGALREVDTALAEGVDAGQLTEQLIGYFRDMLAAAVGCGQDLLLQASSSEFPQLQQVGQRLGVETLLALLQILDQALSRMRQSTHVRTLLELAIVRISRLESLDELSDLVAQLRPAGSEPKPARGSPAREKKNEPAPARHLASEAPALEGPGSQSPGPAPAAANASTPITGRGDPAGSDSGQPTPVAAGPTGPTEAPSAANVTAIWQEVLADLGGMIADFARQAESVQFAAPDRLVASFRAANSLHKEYCERPERRTKLEAALTKALGRPVRLDLELLAGNAHFEPRPVPVPSSRQRIQERQRLPLVRQALEMFGGEILRVDEPRAGGEE